MRLSMFYFMFLFNKMDNQKRKSFTVKEKLAIIDESRKSRLSGRKFSAMKSISEGTLRAWLKSEELLRQVPTALIRKVRNKLRKKIGYFPEIDEKVLEWVLARNQKGLRVKDKFIQMQARSARDEVLGGLEDISQYKRKLAAFNASRIWVHRFKCRNKLRSRRHTTTHTLPERFREQAVGFIGTVHQMCTDYAITRERIINFDQVQEF